MTDEEREIMKRLLKLIVIGGLRYAMVSALTPEQIDAEYERVNKEFDEFTPDKIGV